MDSGENEPESTNVSAVAQRPTRFSLAVSDDGQVVNFSLEGNSLDCRFVFSPGEAAKVGRALIAASEVAIRKLRKGGGR